MKVQIGVLAWMAFSVIPGTSAQLNMKRVDKALLDRQKFLLEIVYSVKDPLKFENYIKLGSKLIIDKSKYTAFDDSMESFSSQSEMGSIVPRGEFFSAIQPYHANQALGLFNFFYHAKEWGTFVSNVAWARMNVNEGMFIQALVLALNSRPDMKDLTLPPIYEILPQMFLNGKYIMKATEFNADFYNKTIGPVHKQKYASQIFREKFFMKDWKVWQWWKLMGLDEDWHLEEKTILRNNIDVLQKDPKYKVVWYDTKAYWLPVDYTRDIEIFNEETKLSYFTEDVGLNAYWYYLNMHFAYMLNGPKFRLNYDDRGGWWKFNVRQLLARYYSERLSVGLGSIDDLSLHGIVHNGYNPQLIAYNGNGFTVRKNYFELSSYLNVEVLNKFNAITRRIDDVIETGKYVTRDGKVIDVTNSGSIGYIGDLIQGNVDIRDHQFFGYWYPFACLYFSGGDFNAQTVVPHVLQNFETMLRDPITYIIFKKINIFFEKFKSNLKPYTPEEVQMSSLKVHDVEISEIRTHFDLVDIDVSTLLKNNMVANGGKLVWNKTLLARQQRLNHEPFSFRIKVKSDKAQRIVVRIFLAPVFDEFGQHIDLFTNTQNFMTLDKFAYDLAVGENVIVRNSKDLANTADDYTTYTEMYKYVMMGYEGKPEYPMEVAQRHCRFPQRLVIPRGWVQGMPMKVIFVLLPYTGSVRDPLNHDFFTCHMGSGDRYIDNFQFDYPFDRKIENINNFIGPNILVKDVKIYHTEKYEKYYPTKYENFGEFDYAFKSVNLTM